MKKSNKPLIKSINSEYGKGDLVLIKDGSQYHVGAYNGVYLQIVRPDVQIPKGDVELELDRIREEQENNAQNLRASELGTKSESEVFLEKERLFRETAFIEFKQKYNIPAEMTMERVFVEIEKSYDVFEDFVVEKHAGVEDDVDEYIGADDLETEEY
jgi:hypothetical protein